MACFFFRLEAEGTSWGRERPLLGSVVSLSPKPPLSSSTAWGGRPKTPLAPLARHGFVSQKCFCCFPSVFSAFKRTFAACPACFRASKALLRLPRRVFRVQKNFCGFPGAVSGFKSAFAPSPACFPRSKELLRLSRLVFHVQKNFSAFPGLFSCFKSIFATRSDAVSAFKSDFFSARAARVSFGSHKNHHSEEFLWQRL